MDAQQKDQLHSLLLPDLKETGKELGRGAYGVVTEVIVSGTTCAAKKLHDVIIQEHTLNKFSDEVFLHSQQRHPNIVQLIGVYYPPDSQLPMLVMEYLPLSLTQCLEREELPLQMKYSILVDVAKGLCYLHGKRPPIVHRDLTANNVLLTSSYSAKISDLGVSRLADTFKKHHLTTVPGNAMVMPPEALEGNPVYDHKLDVFSYGCFILHVLTGQLPQPTKDFVPEPGRRTSYIKVSEWDRRSSCIEYIPKENELLPVAKQCLTDNPTDRPEMINALELILQVTSKYPKMKNRLELIQEKEAKENELIREKEEAERKLAQEINIRQRLEENAANMTEKTNLMNENEQMKANLRTMSLQVSGLQNVHLLKEKEFNDYTQVLKETIRSRDEQLVKQQQSNMDLLKKREADLKDKHTTKLSETVKEYQLKLFRMKEEYEAKMSRMEAEYEAKLLTTAESYEEQLHKNRKECDTRVAEVVKEFMLKSNEALESTVVSKNELLSSLQCVPLASIPSYQTQMELIQPYLFQHLKKGDKWCLVDVKWFNKWKTYIEFNLTDQSSAGETSPHPGPVDNACLFKNCTSEKLKNNLMEDKNYTLLPEPAWSVLVSWYGLSVGSKPIVKNVVEYGVTVKKLKVEVYLIELRLCVHPSSIAIKTYSFSRGDLISDIVTVIKQQFNISDATECRIWECNLTGKYELVTDLKQTVSDAGIYGGQMLILEKRNPDGTWPRDKTK